MKIELRNLKIEDYLDLKETMKQAYPDMRGQYWNESAITRILNVFPEGQLCVVVDDIVVAVALALIIDYDKFGDAHNYRQITGDYTFNTHDPDGNVLYGIDVFVHPDYRGLRLGRRLYEARKELCEALNLKSIMAGGRIPEYSKYAAEMTPKLYISKVKNKEIIDPTLTFQLANDFHVKKILKNYLEEDKGSEEYATLLEWNNIYYSKDEKLFNIPKQVVRIGLVQWQMRLFRDFDAFMEAVEFFVDAVAGYQSDFVLFPELFNAPLMAEFNHLNEADAIRELAEFTIPIRDKTMEFAVSYNTNIITGGMPFIENGSLFNVGYLCRRDGTFEEYRKIHITPNEKQYWGMKGGNQIKVLDTDCGKIGILICYDVEFPELSRILADQGMQLLFVPFLTDTQSGFSRVLRCSQARAIENECYVAIAGCVGNLPRVNNMDIQYAQSAVFTPSDFAFPMNAIKAESTPNTEMTLIVDVDLHLLKELHTKGSVRTMKDRRKDLYEVIYKNKV